MTPSIMTAEQKTALAGFLDTAGDCLGDGYRRPRENYAFTDDAAGVSHPEQGAAAAAGGLSAEGGSPAASAAAAISSGGTLEEIAAEVHACHACPLGAGRTHAVPGEGVKNPLVLVIGEGPGQDEDRTGRPFVGRAGQLLDKMLAAIDLRRQENCFIANVVKCRPPENRDPAPEEAQACRPFLNRQIACLRPRMILCVGKVAANLLLGNEEWAAIGSLRSRFFEYPAEPPIPLLATYHPSAQLRNENLKRPAWEDLKLLRSRLEEPAPGSLKNT
ncbi:MAG: uracil-DNA glycosylase [Treponema sp.]|jgi:DNA polymerase|nr:uracil-DNA glycosylase [Treponema sp.]